MTMSTKRKAPGKLAAPVVKPSAKAPSRNTIDESRTSVAKTDALPTSQPDVIDLSSDGPSDEEDFSEMEDDAPMVNGDQANHAEEDEEEAENGDASPSFGELLQGNATIDVPTLLQQNGVGAEAAPTRTVIAPPPHQSLTTVLTQALKTDDVDLLESCLHTTDLPTIRNTIESIESTLAGNLLTKLASRLYRRPGRAGSLMTWVQWTLIAHGGALASQPKVIQSLSGLQKVLSERAKGLNSLLALKGKLDMLEGQMEMRRKMQRSATLIGQGENSDDEDAIWVEGEDDDEATAGGLPSRRKRDAAAASDDEDDELVMNGGLGGVSSDEEDDSDVEEDDSEDAEEELDEDEVDHDDVDESMGEEEEEEDDSDAEAAPPPKLQKVAKSFGKRK